MTVSAKLNWMAYSELAWRPFLGHQAWSWTTLSRGNVFYYVYKRFYIFVTFFTFFIFIWKFFTSRLSPASRSEPGRRRSQASWHEWGSGWSGTPSPARSTACWWSWCAPCCRCCCCCCSCCCCGMTSVVVAVKANRWSRRLLFSLLARSRRRLMRSILHTLYPHDDRLQCSR